jgi:hypothetical protein
MEGTRDAFFDPETIAILKAVLDEAWSCLPAGQTNVTRSLLAERILKAARDGEPAACELTRWRNIALRCARFGGRQEGRRAELRMRTGRPPWGFDMPQRKAPSVFLNKAWPLSFIDAPTRA